MNIEFKNYIGIYKNVYPQGYCEHLIKWFDTFKNQGAGSNRLHETDKHIKDDYHLFLNLNRYDPEPFIIEENNQKIEHPTKELFFDGLQRCYDNYSEKFSVLRDSGNIRCTTMKIQKTGPGEGYHIWHCEQSNGSVSSRVIVYMLYLNTLKPEDGGETEFLYERTRIRPGENTLILWPAAYTHAHRGNIVLGDVAKYAVTGWFFYDD